MKTHHRAPRPARFLPLGVVLVGALLLMSHGCDSSESACSVDSDCAGEALCVDGACVDPNAGDTTSSDDDTTSTDGDTGADTTADPCGEGRITCQSASASVCCTIGEEVCFEGSFQGCYDDAYLDDPTVLAFAPDGYPQGLTLLGDTLYWADWIDGGCIRSMPKGGDESAAIESMYCEEAGDHPLSLIPFRGGLAWSTVGGDVYYVDAIGDEKQQVASGAGFGPTVITVNYCNDHLAARGDILTWTADGVDLQGEGIGRFDASTGVTDALAADSPFVDGLMMTPSRIHFFHKTGNLASIATDAPAHTLPDVGRAIAGVPCGIVQLESEVFAATEQGALVYVDDIGFEEFGALPDRAGYAVAQGDAVFVATDYIVYQGSLANPQAESFVEVVSLERRTDYQISGLAADAEYLYLTHGGDSGNTYVRRIPR